MLKKYCLLLIGVCFFLTVKAQRSEFGLGGGVSYYVGDLNPDKHLLLSKPAGGVYYRYNFNPRLAIKGMVLRGDIEGDDAVSGFNTERNLNFKSSVLELSAQLEFNFFPYVVGNNDYPFTPYIFVGIGVFSFNPQGELKNPLYQDGVEVFSPGWYDLQPLGTEGQSSSSYPDKKSYPLLSYSIPFGMGLKFNIFRNTSLGLEYGLRKTFTDYLDDVSTTYVDPQVLAAEKSVLAAAMSDKRLVVATGDNVGYQRGNSKTTDWYGYVGISISFRFNTGEKGCPAYGKRRPRYQGVY